MGDGPCAFQNKTTTTLSRQSYITAATMPVELRCPFSSEIEVSPLAKPTFLDFGTVIENPHPKIGSHASTKQTPRDAIRANQGTALKYLDVTNLLDLYGSAPSRVASKAVMNMFVCAPRALRWSGRNGIQGTFQVEILERHPFTTQTFIPLGLCPAEACYLVVVAPSLPPSREDSSLPVPPQYSTGVPLPGRGLPDLTKVQAFIAKGSQAVTYGAGTWHAPMVVVGTKPVDFVVVQYANGVAIEDCQEVLIHSQGREGIQVAIAELGKKRSHRSLKL
jgi:ureidoglycolate lyase